VCVLRSSSSPFSDSYVHQQDLVDILLGGELDSKYFTKTPKRKRTT
jgi:hypothetical protein